MHCGHKLQNSYELQELVNKISYDPLTSFPILTAKIKLTWRCNLKCSFCSVWQKPAIEIPKERVMDTLSYLHKNGLEKIHFSGGEIFLYPYYKEVISYARELDLQVNITTNGTLIDKEIARFLVNQRVHTVAISMDSPRKKIHNLIRGKNAFERTMKGINYLLQRKATKGRGPKIAINTVITKSLIDDIDLMYTTLKELGINSWVLLPIDSDNKKDLPDAEQWQFIADKIPKRGDLISRLPIDLSSERSCQRAAKGKYAGVFYPENRCYAPWFNVFIDADGKTYPCCMGKGEMIPYGNINQTSIKQLLVSKYHDEILLSFSSGYMYPVCERCDDFLEENRIFNQLINTDNEAK
ncbi:MAG: radical SAM protein [Gammaproteobacteria bacterium]|nr:MAG: radical SAM protein [Gammaproteobacteria bacterium]